LLKSREIQMENGFKVCALYKAGLCFQDNCEFLHPSKKGLTPTPTKQQEGPQIETKKRGGIQTIRQSEPQRENQREYRRESQHQDKKEICNFFAKTGTYKFGESCKYNHPEQTLKNDRKEKEKDL